MEAAALLFSPLEEGRDENWLFVSTDFYSIQFFGLILGIGFSSSHLPKKK